MKKIFFLVYCITAEIISGQNLIITNVNVIPIEGDMTILKNHTVIIKNGKIEDIVSHIPERAVKSQMQVIDGTGKYLIPGLADMHVHFPNEKEMSLQQFFKLNLAAGVTTLRSMRGVPRHLTLRDSVNKKLILAPDLYISISLPSDSTITNKELDKFVKQSKKEGWDFIKYLSGLTPELFYTTALISRESGIKLAGHVFNQDLQTAIQAKQASVEHYQAILKEYRKDTLHFDKIMNQLKERKIFVCPTLSFYYIWGMQYGFDELVKRNGMQYITPLLESKWEMNYNDYYTKYSTPEKNEEREKIILRVKQSLYDFGKLLKRMSDANVKLLLSPDESAFNVPGFAVAEEMKLYQKAGLSNYAILRIATYNAASFFNEENEWGSIRNHQKANLVLLDKNPLDDIENIKTVHTVIIGGKAFKPEELLKD
ncbi:MAG: amidohydrolase family protein [Bacteroidia bacterium]